MYFLQALSQIVFFNSPRTNLKMTSLTWGVVATTTVYHWLNEFLLITYIIHKYRWTLLECYFSRTVLSTLHRLIHAILTSIYKADLIISIPILQMEDWGERKVEQPNSDSHAKCTNDGIQAQRTCLILTEFCLLILFIVSYYCSYGWVSIRYKQNSKCLRT